MPYIYVFTVTTSAATDQAPAGAQEVFELHAKVDLRHAERIRYQRGWRSSYPRVVTFAKDAVMQEDGRSIRIDDDLELIPVRSLFPWRNGLSVCSTRYVETFVRYRRLRMNAKEFVEWTHWSD
jgi:hypothetical protein